MCYPTLTKVEETFVYIILTIVKAEITLIYVYVKVALKFS